MTDQERIARSLFNADAAFNPGHAIPWEMQPEKVKASYMTQAREKMQKNTAADDVWRAVTEVSK